MSYLALAKQIEGKLHRHKQEVIAATLPSSISSDAEVNPALLEAEEALFRLWWRTLPNKTMARGDWAAEMAYYGRQKRFSEPFLAALKTRVKDLWETGT